jgi:DNA-binding CsgD family transcriptional regulator/PAS domain-containing protein
MRHRRDKETELLEVIELLYSAAAAPEEWTEAMDRTYALFDSMAAHLFLWNNQLNRPEDSRASRTYLGREIALEYYLRIDPRRTLLERQPIGYTLLCQEHIDEAFVRRNEFFQDYSLRFGRRYVMTTNLLQLGQSTSVIALLRGPRQNPFGSVEKALLERLRPHLVRIERMQKRLAKSQADAALGQDLLNAVQTGFLAADAEARVVRMNQAAEAVLRRGDVIKLAAGRLAATGHAQTTVLHRLIRQATGIDGAVSGGSMIVDGQQGARHAITVTPLSRNSTLLEKPAMPLALVTVSSLEQPARPNRQLSEMFGLTPAEAELAAAVGAGKRLNDVAEERRVRMTTLRSQIRAVYSKTGTNRQAELAQMIASLPMSRTQG